MAELVVLGFDDRIKAEEAFDLITRDFLQSKLISLGDAAVAWRDATGYPRIQQALPLPNARGAGRGALWGTLIGTLFLSPLLGMAVGATAGALRGMPTDIGIDDKTIKEIAAALEPGRAAIFLLVTSADFDAATAALKRFGPTVIRTSLTHDRQEGLVDALG